MKLIDLYPFIMEDTPIIINTSDGEERYTSREKVPIGIMSREIITDTLRADFDGLEVDVYDET